MEAAIKRVMSAYGLLKRLTVAEEREAREDLRDFLAQLKITDEHQLAVEGVKYLRGDRPSRRRAR